MAAASDSSSRESFHNPLLGRAEALIILGAAAMMMAVAFGVRQSLGLFQAPLVAHLGIAPSS